MAIIVVEQPATEMTVARPTFNFQHFTTPHGMLLLGEFIVAIIIFCLGPPLWLNIISWLAWIVNNFLIFAYVFSWHERFGSNPPFRVVEFYFYAGTMLLYALCTLLNFIFVHWVTGIFAAVNAVAFAASAFLLMSEWNSYRANAGAPPALPK